MSERQDKEIPTRTDSQSQTTPPESPPAAPPVVPPVAPLAEEQEMPSTGTGSGSGVSASTGALATAPAQQGTDDTDQGVIERDDRESPAGDSGSYNSNNNGRLRLSNLMELLPRSISGFSGISRSSSGQQHSEERQQQPQQQHPLEQQQQQQEQQQEQQQQQQLPQQQPQLDPQHIEQYAALSLEGSSSSGGDADGNSEGRKRSPSQTSEVLLLNMVTGQLLPVTELANGDRSVHRDEFGTQRVYKKTSPNCVLTLYLPTREIQLTGNNASVLRGIVFVDPKAIQGYRVYAQLTLTFRYGREDEEVMGLRFCNEAIMSLHQIWPRLEEPTRESLSPLQEALMKRLGDGAHPFTLTLTAQAPPSVQLVPAKRYYGAPIGTSYDVRCFIADKTDEKFHRRASVKMGVRVIYRTDVFHHHTAPEHCASFAGQHGPCAVQSPPASSTPPLSSESTNLSNEPTSSSTATAGSSTGYGPVFAAAGAGGKSKSKSERGDSFPKLRLSPKSFRFSGRFGRSKSEIEKCPNDPFHCYSKSFQEHCDNTGSGMLPPHSNAGVTGGIGGISVGPCGGPQGAVDKPFLLHDGRVGLRASLDKGWYTHGEDVNVTVNIRNDSRKTVRKVRVCAIQHVDVCMFNNGKFKNVVADSDTISPAVDRNVPPGGTLNTSIALRPQRGPTKNWIALEDTLQRSTEPNEITGAIAASAIRSPNFVMQAQQLLTGQPLGSPAMPLPHGQQQQQQQQQQHHQHHHQSQSQSHCTAINGGGGNTFVDDRNVFAIYVSYYVKVKLTLSGMGGELSLKLPFVLVHVDESQRPGANQAIHDAEQLLEKMALHDVPVGRRRTVNAATSTDGPSTSAAAAAAPTHIDSIDPADDEFNIQVPVPKSGGARSGSSKRRLQRSETLARDLDENDEVSDDQHMVQVHLMHLTQEDRRQREEHAAAARGAVPKTTNV